MYGHQAVGLLPDDYPQFVAKDEGAHIWDTDGDRSGHPKVAIPPSPP